VRLAEGAPAVDFTAPADALGVAMLECLPAGDNGRKWRRLFNEAQVVLHAHPVNAARVAAGKRPVNALWFWGAGALPGAVETALTAIASDDDVLRGLAKIANVAVSKPTPAALRSLPQDGDALLEPDAAAAADELRNWLPEFRQCLRAGRFDTLMLTFADGKRFRIRHAHRLRFWRRA
jgi:hypothetical protein